MSKALKALDIIDTMIRYKEDIALGHRIIIFDEIDTAITSVFVILNFY